MSVSKRKLNRENWHVKRRVILRVNRRIDLRVLSGLNQGYFVMGYDCIKKRPRAYSLFLRPLRFKRRSICHLTLVSGFRPRRFILS